MQTVHGSHYRVEVRVERCCPMAKMFLNSNRVGAQVARHGAGKGQCGPFSKVPLRMRAGEVLGRLGTPGIPGRAGSGNDGRGQQVSISLI